MLCMASVEEKLKPVPVGGSNNLLEEMKMLKEMQQNTVPRKHINTELWHACAGPLVTLPQLGSLVYYFPQGHSEQVAVSTNRASTAQIPNYPNLPPQLLCQVHNVTLHADKHTDEIYAQISLQPVNSDKDVVSVPDFGLKPSKHPTDFFFKTLTASDTSTHGGFSVPRRAAEKLFPPLDFSMQPPSQELVVRDLHDNAWNFRHIYRGQPKRHLLTTGWSMFIGAKQLRAGDAVLFVRDEKSQLLVGVRRANRQQATLPSSVLSADSMHIGILAAAAHAAANRTPFTIFYNPRACSSEFVIPFGRFQKAVFGAQLSVGMRFGMMFETEESNKRRYMGTIHGISDLDPRRWPNSKWRCLQVEWDEPGCGDKRNRVSPWEIETPESLFIFPSLAANFKRPFNSAFMGSQTEWDSLVNMPLLRVPDNSSPGIWSDQLKKMLVKPQDKLASTEFVASAMRSSNGDASLKEVKSLQSAVKHKPDEDVFEPEEGHNSSVVFQGAGNFTSFGNNTTDYVQGTPQINQLTSPGEGNAEKVAAKQVYPQCFVNDLGATEQNPLLQYPGQADFVSSPATCNSLESFRNPGSLCMVKNHQSPPSDTLYMPQERQELMDSDITGTKSATQTSSFSMLVSQQDISNFPYSSCWQKDRNGEKSNNGDIYGCLNLDVSNYGSTVIGPSLSSALLDDVCGIKNADFHNSSEMLVVNFSSNQDVQSQITSVSLADSQAFSMQEYADNSGGTSSSNVDFDNTFLQHGSWNQVATRFRTYTKIQKAGSVGRSIDVSAFKNYDELRSEIEIMFGLEGLLNDLGSGWKLVYVDFESDVLLVGDDPWEEFVGCVKCIRILSPSEVKRMGEEGMQLLNTVGMQGIDGAYSTR